MSFDANLRDAMFEAEIIAGVREPGAEMKRFIRDLSAVLLAGPWNKQALFVRQIEAFGAEKKWMRGVAALAFGAFPGIRPPRLKLLQLLLQNDRELLRLKRTPALKSIQPLLAPSPMIEAPEEFIAPQNFPRAHSAGDLCRWFEVSPERLGWFAGNYSREHSRSSETLRHYSYKWIRKRSGGWRLLEIPKSKLKEIQRRIHAEILSAVSPHECAKGFGAGDSVLNFVRGHVGRPMVLRMDLQDFFNSVEASRVHAIFRMAGYSEPIARTLTALCTNTVPSGMMQPPEPFEWVSPSRRMQLKAPHLPQGAPTSPALANLSAFHFDARLDGLSKKFEWTYTRYADDLLFSGPVMGKKLLAQFRIWVAEIARAEHFRINPRKTRVMRRSVCQRAAGLVLNEKPNIARAKFDELKAILHNCVMKGPASQNREGRLNFRAHLAGRVSYVSQINPEKGKRLNELFERIAWPESSEPSL